MEQGRQVKVHHKFFIHHQEYFSLKSGVVKVEIPFQIHVLVVEVDIHEH
jgi:hypothetical protein